jgi:site-specific recombinase XerD
MSLSPNFPQLLHTYFNDWLMGQRNLSHHTILSYRDAWRLFLRFVAQHHQCRVVDITFTQLTAQEVIGFLEHLEQDRQVSILTRNNRLAALHSFFAFVADHEPMALAQCADVLRIPTKRGPRAALCYLEPAEVEAILAQPDRQRLEGQRDHALLAFLYNSGARIQEALNLCPKDIRFEPPAQVRLLGKGRKERICPLWPETAALLAALLRRQPRESDEPIFVNRYGKPLGASGIRFQLRRYVKSASQQLPTLSAKHVTPHTFRHYLPFLTMSGNAKYFADMPGNHRSRRPSLDLRTRHSFSQLEIVEKVQKLIARLITTQLTLRWCRFGECLLFHRQCGFQINLGGFDRFMPEPQGNHGSIHTGLQQLHGHGVPQAMDRDPLV